MLVQVSYLLLCKVNHIIFFKLFVIHLHVSMVEHVFLILNIPIAHVFAPWQGVLCNLRKLKFSLQFFVLIYFLEYFHIMLASNLTFSSDYYFNTLGSASYLSLSNDIFAWLNTAFAFTSSSNVFN